MTQEDKELLLKDLCARLPYGIKITNGIYTITLKVGIDTAPATLAQFINSEGLKYYLRPLSSMTEKELHEYNMHLLGITTGVDAVNFMIWIYQYHLDILHFIERGLALEAPEGMYN